MELAQPFYFYYHFLRLAPWCCVVVSLELRKAINLFRHNHVANTIMELLQYRVWLKCVIWKNFVFVIGVPLLLWWFRCFFSFAFFSYYLIPVLYIRLPFMVVCLQIVVLTFMYVWFENIHFLKLDTTCGEIMANLKRQKVELLIYTHGKLLQCPPDVIQWEDKSSKFSKNWKWWPTHQI